MAITPVPEHLIHKPVQVEANAKKFDQLCSIFADVARPYIETELRQASENDRKNHPVLDRIFNFFGYDFMGYSDEIVDEQTSEASQVCVSTWLSYLNDLEKIHGADVTLNEYLMDNKLEYTRPFFNLTIEACGTAIRSAESFGEIMKTFASQIVDGNGTIDLPLNIQLKQEKTATDKTQYRLTHS